MEDIPPSYDDINANVLDLLPPYLSTASLVNLCLVSKSYYATFAPHLWGSPASHFVHIADETSRTTNGINFANLQVSGSQNDMVYVALTRFKRVLRKARLSTRMLCHTLHLPPALSEIYGGPNSTWLRDVLDWLPALQSLCVSGLPFFDHDSLVAVDQNKSSATPLGLNDKGFRRYPPKLLLAAKEPNVTWVGLSLLIPHLPDIVYLDLSYTSPARNINVLKSLDALHHLQILKLRGIGLRDNELEVLANVIGLRVRLLDIAENQLSDMAIRSLLQACVWLPSSTSTDGPIDQYSRRHLESWPVGLPPPPDSLSLDTIRSVELDEALLNQLTHPLTGRLAFEDIPHGGITHLYVSGNSNVTIESIRSMLDLGRLHVLDAGDIGALTSVDLQVLAARSASSSNKEAIARARSISTANMNIRGLLTRHKSRPSSVYSGESGPQNGDQVQLDEEMLKMPGAEKLVPVLKDKASNNLTHLRIDHAVATSVLDIAKEMREKDKTVKNVVELPGELSRASELDAVNREVYEAPGSKTYAAEMPAESAVFEMDATPAPFRAELPGDPIHFAVSPPIGDALLQNIDEVSSSIRGEGAMAPEVLEQAKSPSNDEEEENIVLDANGSGIKRKLTSSTASTVSTLQSMSSIRSPAPSIERPAPLQIRRSPERRRNETVQPPPNHGEIAALMNLRPKGPPTKLYPSFLPNLRTLILTNIPPQVPSEAASLIENLKTFIIGCAAESRLATLKAKTNYSLPPGRARQDAERQHARTLFALRTIVLEVNAEIGQGQQRGWKHTRQRFDISKSSTGDRDSEALWSAAEDDFSFFGEGGEEFAECGIYEQEPDKYYPTSSFDDKIMVTNADHTGGYDPPNNMQSSRISTQTATHRSRMTLTPMSPMMRNGTIQQSPRNLPLGRNRRTSNEMPRGGHSPSSSEFQLSSRAGPGSPFVEMPGTIPLGKLPSMTSNPVSQPPPAGTVMLDVVAELAKWRRERKSAYEQEVANRVRHCSSISLNGRLADAEVYVEGYWPGEVKVIRNAKKLPVGKGERQGNVDVYGNYFEGGYLYP